VIIYDTEYVVVETPHDGLYYKLKIRNFDDEKGVSIDTDQVTVHKICKSNKFYFFVFKIKNCYVFLKKTNEEINKLSQDTTGKMALIMLYT